MKQDIHPDWHHDCVVTCSCGNSFVTGAMSKTLSVDICSACHPFFTGEMRFVDRQGRVDKFIKKRSTAEAIAKAKKNAKKATQKTNAPVKSYKQILQEQQTAIKNLKKSTVLAEKETAADKKATKTDEPAVTDKKS
jgi:large subunit ribosomal protein L31